MLRRIPTKEEIDKVIETYHNYPIKGISIDMLKEARIKTSLGFAEIKKILGEYINKLKG